MSNNEQDQVITSIDAVVNKMESYFLSTYEEMRQLRQEVQELTRILKAQRAEKMINVEVPAMRAQSIGQILNKTQPGA